jgi:nucleotide-binding universal stress UspA family protein
MSAVILAVLDHPGAAAGVLNAAECLADLLGDACISALAISTPPAATVVLSEEVLTEQHEAQVRASEQARVASSKVQFDAWAAKATVRGPTAKWIDVEGDAEATVGEWGGRADFLVIERPARHEYGTTWHAARAALFTTDRPVLIVPSTFSSDFGRRVAIAWRDDRRTIKAVIAGLRCLTRAERVFVLAGARDCTVQPSLPPILLEHGIAADLHTLPIGVGAFGDALLAKAHELGADLLVMGAFGHNPLHQMLLGGVTRYMLSHADLPVLMRH